ncbi:hypothetical protein D9M68_686010 [compost metagenome]
MPETALASVPSVARFITSVPLSAILPLPRPATSFSCTVAPEAIAVSADRPVLAPCTSSGPPFTFSWPAPVREPAEVPPLAMFSVPPFIFSVEPAWPSSCWMVWVVLFRSVVAALAMCRVLVLPSAWSTSVRSVPEATVVSPV